MSKVKSAGMKWTALTMLWLAGCGQKESAQSSATDENVHINFVARTSTMLLGVTDSVISELVVRRSACPDGGEPVDYTLKQIPSEKNFVLNEQRAFIEGCTLRIRSVTLTWKELSVNFAFQKEQSTSAQTYEAVLANPSKTAFLNIAMPQQVGVAVDRNVFWSVNISYIDDKMRLFPIAAEAREAGVEPLGLTISYLEDRGTVNTIWRETGVSLSCGGVQSLGTCNGYELSGLTARFVRQSDVDITVAQQIRYQGSVNDLLFTAGLTHLVGSGLRFTLNMPIASFGENLYLILMRGQGYTVFNVPAGSIPASVNQ